MCSYEDAGIARNCIAVIEVIAVYKIYNFMPYHKEQES